jgi:peroxiredoxin family protein
MYGCQMSMMVMEIPEEKMIKERAGCVGVGFSLSRPPSPPSPCLFRKL